MLLFVLFLFLSFVFVVDTVVSFLLFLREFAHRKLACALQLTVSFSPYNGKRWLHIRSTGSLLSGGDVL